MQVSMPNETQIVAVTIALSVLIAVFPPCSYSANVGNVNSSGFGPLPVWVAMRSIQNQRESLKGGEYRPGKYQFVTVWWQLVVPCQAILWGSGLGLLIYRSAMQLEDEKKAVRFILCRTSLTGFILGLAIVPLISLLEPWARAVPFSNPMLSVSPLYEFIGASVVALIMAGMGTMAGFVLGSGIIALAERQVYDVNNRRSSSDSSALAASNDSHKMRTSE